MVYKFMSLFLFFISVISFSAGFLFLNNYFSLMIDWEVFSLASTSLTLTFYIDWMSLFFSGTVLLISSMVIFYSDDYMYNDVYSFRFLILVFLFILSMMLMIYSLNMVSILLGWDGLGLVSYCLVIYYQNPSSYSSGMLTVLTNRVGDVFILIGIGWIFNFGSFNFIYYLDMNYSWTSLFIFLLILASFTKSAQLPFSSWLPAAMAAPTPVSSLVHSSTLVTAGVYLLIRFGNLLFMSSMVSLFFYVSLLTMLMSGIGANFEYDLKKIVAFSTLSQLGLMMSVLFSGNFDLSYFHLLSHAFFKSLLFMCSGLIIHSMCDSQDIRYMGYILNDKPYMGTCFMVSNLSLCGLFFTSGFYSKDVIVEFYLFSNFNFFMGFLYLFCISLTVCYTIRLLFYTLFFGVVTFSFRSVSEGQSSFFSLIILLFFSLFFGSMFMWLTFLTPILFFFPFYIKMLTFFFMLFGLFMCMLFYNLNIKIISLFNFFGSMWYIMFLGNSYLNFNYFFLSSSYKSLIDDSWGDFMFLLSEEGYFLILEWKWITLFLMI
uniref:NADH-ubiquinone oxidoreductase chain 5 n=1 Tax=Corythucha ciliata TaxID=369451 RepID=V5JFC4_CORCT|nr:NADH dehydrogenase subunit 5 [Corythucha ciliata]AGM48383.1 NADH dehydrogenase subunit 5 [Corythucha ciliata]